MLLNLSKSGLIAALVSARLVLNTECYRKGRRSFLYVEPMLREAVYFTGDRLLCSLGQACALDDILIVLLNYFNKGRI
jgi:hypothetical protein